MGCGIISGIMAAYYRTPLDVRNKRLCIPKSAIVANPGHLGRDSARWTIYEFRTLDILQQRAAVRSSILGDKIHTWGGNKS